MKFSNFFFFIRFTFLFFFYFIFNVWSIDMNSEEIFVSFSFGLLVVMLILATKFTILTFFLNTFNLIYNRFLNLYLASIFTYELMIKISDWILDELNQLKLITGIVIFWAGMRILFIKKLQKSLNFFKFFCRGFFALNFNIFILNELKIKTIFNFKHRSNNFFNIPLFN